jgi:hypothetical protein
MIDLTTFLRKDFDNNWATVIDWLSQNVGRLKLSKFQVVQGDGWLIMRKVDEVTYQYTFTLYFDDPSDGVMFKLALL